MTTTAATSDRSFYFLVLNPAEGGFDQTVRLNFGTHGIRCQLAAVIARLCGLSADVFVSDSRFAFV